MDSQERKHRLRINRRKEKVRRLIGDQEVKVAAIKPEDYRRHQDYLRAKSLAVNTLRRLKRELLALEDGRLPGEYVNYPLQPDEER